MEGETFVKYVLRRPILVTYQTRRNPETSSSVLQAFSRRQGSQNRLGKDERSKLHALADGFVAFLIHIFRGINDERCCLYQNDVS
jgi:hypothetical protein